MKLSLKTNLQIGLGISLVLLLLSSIASFVSIKNLIKSTDLVAESNMVINDLDNIISTLKDAETGQRGYLLTDNTAFLAPYYGSRERIASLFEKITKDTEDNAFQQRKISELKSVIDARMDALTSVIEFKKENTANFEDLLIKGKLYMDNARQIVREIKANEHQDLSNKTAKMNELSGYSLWLIIFAAVVSLFSTLYFYNKVNQEFTERLTLYNQLQEVNERTSKRIDIIKSVARQISNGNYKVRIQEDSKDGLGALSTSLNKMAEALHISFTQLEDKDWMQSGIAALNEKMVGEKDVFTLCSDILEAATTHTKSAVGAFYLLDDENKLHLTASYALSKENLKASVSIGEGLVGQAFESQKLILLDKVPQNEVTISYAAGQTRPAKVVAFPVLRNGYPMGVIELGTVNQYPPRKIDYMHNIASNIGIALSAAQNRKKLQDFLEETQTQAEELQAQHAELETLNSNLETLNAELEAQTQKIQASEEELRVQQEELIQSNQELEERTSLLEERNTEIRRKASQLEQSTKYKSEFLANMSHELRTPLNSILLLSKLMAESEDLKEEYTEYAGVIQSSGQGLLSLIDEILDLSKIEAGKMELEISPITIEEITIDMRSLFNPVAKDKHLDLFIGVAGNTPNSFNSDKFRLSQILKNLLSNAFKFTSTGHVKFYIGFDEDTNMLSFAVSDTGIGIAKEKQHLVFEAFQQADGSTKRKFGGTGLGLSISKELARILGGHISLQSAEGEGSTFTLFIPTDISKGIVVEESEREDKSNFEHDQNEERYVIENIPNEIEDDRDLIQADDRVLLIIEDDTNFAKTLLKFTRKRGYKGLVAVRGDVGIELAQQFRPTAILLDIQLPVKDGWQVMDELKSNPHTKPIPIHVMSSLPKKKESLLKGAVDFINKPFALEHMQEIFEKIEHALNKTPKKVLIIEENKQHAEALSFFLTSYNIQTTVASNIENSISTLQGKEIDCVILDMGVPDKAAYQALETIKKSEGLENLPIIIFTGKNLSKGEENRIKHYANSIVLKTAHSYQRILDEAALFLHLVEEKSGNGVASKNTSLQSLTDTLRGKTVLVADDDVRNIFSLTKALELHKMTVIAAVDGREALAAMHTNANIDVVLMDMMMPELDGYETIKEIRKTPKFKNLPILAVTAKAMMGDREKCIAAGASDYISKPVDVDQLVSLLRVWLYK